MNFDPGQLRRQAGISQREMAELMRMHQPTISRIEAGQRRLTIDEADQWVRLCGLRLMMEPTDGIQSLSEDDVKLVDDIIALLPNLNAANKTTLRALITLWRPPDTGQ
jgi:transcriptional regulator with XRE-family HTH domain